MKCHYCAFFNDNSTRTTVYEDTEDEEGREEAYCLLSDMYIDSDVPACEYFKKGHFFWCFNLKEFVYVEICKIRIKAKAKCLRNCLQVEEIEKLFTEKLLRKSKIIIRRRK